MSEERNLNDIATSGPFRTETRDLHEMRVACVLDPFSFSCFEPECNLYNLSSQGWRYEIDAFRPELLLVESAWQGKNETWRGKRKSSAYKELFQFCRQRGIPSAYWGKEDPVSYDDFFAVAKEADFVFTTDADCIERYKHDLEHDRVYLMHFAAQPKLHNPIELYERRDKTCFAGSYYPQYRTRYI